MFVDQAHRLAQQFFGFLYHFFQRVEAEAVHVAQLIGFRNKLLVLVEWAWEYFTYERAVRLITADQVRERGEE